MRLKKIHVGTSSQSTEINQMKRYRVQVDGGWYEGTFRKDWFGWKSEEYGRSGIQLNLIDEVDEIVPPEKKVKRKD